MTRLGRESMLAAAATLLLVPLAFAQTTDAEFKCQQKVDKAGAKFIGAKSKCVSKCLSTFWKGDGPSSDCFPPYGGVTAQCINDTALNLKGAEDKFEIAIKKACDPATKTGTECPNCYNGGDCSSSGFATDQVANLEGQVDSFVPGVACETGADEDEQKCQLATAKALAKQVSSVVKCYDKCQSNARKGLISASTCAPPASDVPTAECILKADTKAIIAIDKNCGPECLNGNATCGSNTGTCSNDTLIQCGCDADCGPQAAAPDCTNPDDYPTGSQWVNLVEIAISGQQTAIYCVPASTTSTSSSTTSSSAAPTTSSSAAPTTSSSVAPTTSSSAAPTTSSSAAPTTSSSSSTTATPTTSSSTSTTTGGGPSGFDFLSTSASGVCGNTFRDLAGTIPLKNLLCGGLSIGGGISQVPDNSTPPGATNRFTLSCVGSSCTLGSTTSGSTPTGVDCTDIGCKFGTPLPISNAGLSVCVTNTFSPVQPSGTLDLVSGAATWNFQLNSATILTGIPTQPCPICATAATPALSTPPQAACNGTPGAPCTGKCNGGPNDGLACTSRNPNGLGSDCPAPSATAGNQRCYGGPNNDLVCSTGANCAPATCAQFIGNIAISLNPLTTGTATLSNASGLFCPGQTATQHGAFNSAICQTGANSGKPCVNNTTSSAPDVANCGAGVNCRPGNLNNYCTAGTNNGLGCVTAADCGTGGVCGRAGAQVQLIREVGAPVVGGLSVGVPKAIKLGTSFCVGATTNATVNSNANLPGPGATSVVGTITLLP